MTYHDPVSKFTKQSIYWPCLFCAKQNETNKQKVHSLNFDSLDVWNLST